MTAFLDEMEFPASKIDVIAEAEAAGASQELIERLQTLGVERFETREAAEAALADETP